MKDIQSEEQCKAARDEFLRRLEQFSNAAVELQIGYAQIDEDQDQFLSVHKGYPFPVSLDEIVKKIERWRDLCNVIYL